jgi:Transglycosylase-like domain
MSRGAAIAALLTGAVLTAAGAWFVADLAAGSPELEGREVAGAVAPVRQAHRPMVVSLRESPRLLGVRRAQLESIADCESHGDPRARSSDGLYRGKYQFHRGTWAGIGGDGDPARAPELEQDLRAAMLFRESGPGHWPSCG